jgi:DegV family protein with EDD domain
MGSICILTDSTAQFPQFGFSGKNDVRIITYPIEINGEVREDSTDLKASDLPPSSGGSFKPRLQIPTPEKFQELFVNLGSQYRDVIAILASSKLLPAYDNARLAADSIHGRVRITMIDSQTISAGLGLLVQRAAEAVAEGMPVVEIERLVRSLVPHVYMMLYTPGLTYLHDAGFIDSSQAVVGEMLGMLPIFTLEEGQLSPIEKVRNMRGLVDFMQEFILEFDELKHIAFIQSSPPAANEAKMMREHAQSCFPQTPFSELDINLPVAMLTGPRTIGLVAMEKPETGHSR